MKQRLNKRAAFEQGRLFVGLHFKFYFCSMKCRFLLWIILPVLLASCSPGRYPASLLTADSLSSVRPDSALCLLARLAVDTADAPLSHRMYYRLLCIKAADKAYLPHTSDSLIRPVLHYYIEGGDPRLLPEAYYYAGRVYRDLGDAPQALDYFRKALDILEGHENLPLKSKVYSQMGTLFLYQHLYAEALEIYRKSYRCNRLLGDSTGMIFNFRDMADAYRNLNKTDSACNYYQQAYRLGCKIGAWDLARGVQSQLASLYLDMGQYENAYTSLQEALQDIERPDMSGIYTIAARYYDERGQTDSAAWYYTQLLKVGSAYAKQTTYRRLLDMAMQAGNLPLARKHLAMYHVYADSVHQLTQTEAVNRIHSLYNYQLREQENARLKEKNARYMRHTRFILSALLLLALSFFAYWQYAKRRKEKLEFRLLQVRQLQDEAERRDNEFLQKNKAHVRELEAQLAVLREENNATWAKLNEERERYSALVRQVEAEQALRQQADQLSAKSDIVQLLKKKAKSPTGQATVTSTEWEALEKQVRLQYPYFLSKLKSLCYHFRRDELRLCMLIKMGFGPSDIGMLMEHPVQTITTMRRRLAKNILQLPEIRPQDWDIFIHSL